MIPYDQLVQSLIAWRIERGLPVTSGAQAIHNQSPYQTGERYIDRAETAMADQEATVMTSAISAEATVMTDAVSEDAVANYEVGFAEDSATAIVDDMPQATIHEVHEAHEVLDDQWDDPTSMVQREGAAAAMGEVGFAQGGFADDEFDDATAMVQTLDPDSFEEASQPGHSDLGFDEATQMVQPVGEEIDLDENFDEATSMVNPVEEELVLEESPRASTENADDLIIED